MRVPGRTRPRRARHHPVSATLVLPAGGHGSRMRAVDAETPKELLPLGGQPVIRYAIDEAVDAGIDPIVAVIAPHKSELRAYLESRPEALTVVEQPHPIGEADAIAMAEEHIESEAAAVIYPDNVHLPAPGALRRLLEAHRTLQRDIVALSPVTAENEHGLGNAGRVDLDAMGEGLHRIERFLAKTPGRFERRFQVELRACGMMVTGPHVFDLIRRARKTHQTGEFTDQPLREWLVEQCGMVGVEVPGEVFDVGNPEGYRWCQQALTEHAACKRPSS